MDTPGLVLVCRTRRINEEDSRRRESQISTTGTIDIGYVIPGTLLSPVPLGQNHIYRFEASFKGEER